MHRGFQRCGGLRGALAAVGLVAIGGLLGSLPAPAGAEATGSIAGAVRAGDGVIGGRYVCAL